MEEGILSCVFACVRVNSYRMHIYIYVQMSAYAPLHHFNQSTCWNLPFWRELSFRLNKTFNKWIFLAFHSFIFAFSFLLKFDICATRRTKYHKMDQLSNMILQKIDPILLNKISGRRNWSMILFATKWFFSFYHFGRLTLDGLDFEHWHSFYEFQDGHTETQIYPYTRWNIQTKMIRQPILWWLVCTFSWTRKTKT